MSGLCDNQFFDDSTNHHIDAGFFPTWANVTHAGSAEDLIQDSADIGTIPLLHARAKARPGPGIIVQCKLFVFIAERASAGTHLDCGYDIDANDLIQELLTEYYQCRLKFQPNNLDKLITFLWTVIKSKQPDKVDITFRHPRQHGSQIMSAHARIFADFCITGYSLTATKEQQTAPSPNTNKERKAQSAVLSSKDGQSINSSSYSMSSGGRRPTAARDGTGLPQWAKSRYADHKRGQNKRGHKKAHWQ